jgi:hypothetical protein
MIAERLKFLHLRFHKKRTAVTSPNLPYLLWRYVANGARTGKVLFRKPDAQIKSVIDEMNRSGVVVDRSASFLSSKGQSLLDSLSSQILAVARSDETKFKMENAPGQKKESFLIHLVPQEQEHGADSDLLKLALDPKLLGIVSSYLGMWPRLHAINVWLNFATTDDAKESQLWHRDPEDMRTVKAFIYLADVDENRGPFSYIPGSQPFGALSGAVPSSVHDGRITDEEMAAAIPPEKWLACTGTAGTMVLADTIGYHRGGKPKQGERILISFSYTSGTPMSRRKLNVPNVPHWADEVQRAALA